MSSFNQNGQTASATTAISAEQQSPDFMNDLAELEALMPKNLSSNKRAVIERLVRLHQQNQPKK